jgi:hypothetical protein
MKTRERALPGAPIAGGLVHSDPQANRRKGVDRLHLQLQTASGRRSPRHASLLEALIRAFTHNRRPSRGRRGGVRPEA